MNIKHALLICLSLLAAGCACRSTARARMAPTAVAAEPGAMRSVYFPFDSAEMTDEQRSIAKENLSSLSQRGNPRVELAGHCDERGSVQYNQALGLKRSQSTMDYLESLGANPSQFTAISHGESMPADPAHNETAWSKNRRVDFNLK